MLIVALVATLAAGLQWRQWRMIEQEAGARAQSQASWVLVGALDWARLILREDARSAGTKGLIDHLGEPWAVPLKEARLSSFLMADSLQDSAQDTAYLSGYITDAQSKINLTNWAASPKGETLLANKTYQSLVRLYDALNLPLDELKNLAQHWQTSNGQSLRPTHIEQLTWLGVSNASALVLKNYLTILPGSTPINLNTASALVIFAAAPGIEMDAAEKLVLKRSHSPLQTLDQARSELGKDAAITDTDFSIYSRYFEVQGHLRLGDWAVVEESLVKREDLQVTTVWRRRL